MRAHLPRSPRWPLLATILATLTTLLADTTRAATFDASTGSADNLATFTLTNIARANFPYYAANIARSAGAKTSCAASTPRRTTLEWNTALAAAASYHTGDMMRSRCFSHNDCNCSGEQCSFAARLRRFYQGPGASENIAAGAQDPVELLDLWLASSGHCKNMMSAEAREIGISAVSGGSATQNFGGGGSGSRAGTLLSGMAIGSNFVAVVGGGGTSMSVTLWSDGKPTMMNHVGGGIYVVSKGMARCATYYFQVGDDGTRTFPSGDRGMLRFNCNGQPLYAADPKRRPSTRELSANNAAQEPAAAPSSRVADAPSTTAVPKATTSVVAPPVDSATISTMSAGTKAGISVTVVAFMGVLGIAAVVYRRRRHRAAIEQTEFVENYPMSFYRPRSMSEGETSGKDHQSNKFVLRQPALPSIHIDGISEDDTDTDSMPHLAALPTDYSANRPSVISFQHARRSTVQGHLHPNPLGSIDITSPTGHRDSTHSVIDLYAYYRQSIAIRRTSNESVEIMQDRLAASPNGHRSSGFQASPTMETRRVKSFVAESVLDDIDRELDELDVDIVEEEVVVITESDEE